MRRLRKAILISLAALSVLCVLAGGVSAVSNARQPRQSTIVDQFSEADKAFLAEATHLRQAVGDSVWPGWGQADIPLILYNERHAFLAGLDEPAAGWVKVPDMATRGGAWLPVEGDALAGQVYYWQAVDNASSVIGAFTVKVGERWVAALSTSEWSRIEFQAGLGSELPPVLRQVFPYSLAYEALMGKGDRYVTALLHESFHAYEGMLQPERLAAAERTSALADRYPWDDAALKSAWQKELATLQRAVLATSTPERAALARQFLQERQQRRSAASTLSPQLVEYERQQEWLEGLAKYAEMSVGLAAAGPGYQPLPEALSAIPGFRGYASYPIFYQAQLREVGRIDNRSGNTRFYYGGMAQAVLLDDLSPDWKPLAMQDGACLEDLLRAALQE
ncbi:MAG TPA: hypothetical protein PLJ35_10345 [Anaerolineae bacterium]|nr:hypothetical protein [Anaerolineae bacterium]